MTKAYLVKLSGIKDQEWKLLDQEAWDHLRACLHWNQHTQPAPVPPKSAVEDVVDDLMDYHTSRNLHIDEDKMTEEATESLTPKMGRSAGNDVAMRMVGSSFHQDVFHSHEPSIKDLNAFVAKHGLDMEEAYDGLLY